MFPDFDDNVALLESFRAGALKIPPLKRGRGQPQKAQKAQKAQETKKTFCNFCAFCGCRLPRWYSGTAEFRFKLTTDHFHFPEEEQDLSLLVSQVCCYPHGGGVVAPSKTAKPPLN